MIQPLVGQSLPVTPFVICTSAGEVLRGGSCPAEMIPLQAGAGEYAFAGTASDLTQYIANVTTAPTATDRPASPVTLDTTSLAADATEIATLANVAAGAAITVTGPVSFSGTGDGNPVELTFGNVGYYRVRVTHFPDLDFEAAIHAT